MSERLVLIDSSAWINYLLGQKVAHARSVDKLLLAHRGAVNAIIRVELLTGARDEKQYAELEDALDGLHFLELTSAVWRRAERLRFRLKRAGHVIPLPDVVIACSALIHDCELLHADHHFDRIAQSIPLKIHHSPS